MKKIIYVTVMVTLIKLQSTMAGNTGSKWQYSSWTEKDEIIIQNKANLYEQFWLKNHKYQNEEEKKKKKTRWLKQAEEMYYIEKKSKEYPW